MEYDASLEDTVDAVNENNRNAGGQLLRRTANHGG